MFERNRSLKRSQNEKIPLKFQKKWIEKRIKYRKRHQSQELDESKNDQTIPKLFLIGINYQNTKELKKKIK